MEKFGWIIKSRETGMFATAIDDEPEVPSYCDEDYTKSLKKALVMPTRGYARFWKAPGEEVVLKVELTKKGKAKRIVGRG